MLLFCVLLPSQCARKPTTSQTAFHNDTQHSQGCQFKPKNEVHIKYITIWRCHFWIKFWGYRDYCRTSLLEFLWCQQVWLHHSPGSLHVQPLTQYHLVSSSEDSGSSTTYTIVRGVRHYSFGLVKPQHQPFPMLISASSGIHFHTSISMKLNAYIFQHNWSKPIPHIALQHTADFITNQLWSVKLYSKCNL